MSHPRGSDLYLDVELDVASLAPQPAPPSQESVDPFGALGMVPASGPIPEVSAPGAGAGAPFTSASDQAYGAPPRPQPTLTQGSNGPSVFDLQTRLNRRGEALAIDGVFGPLTRAAVVRFQEANGLVPDGIVGPMTWGALDAQPASGEVPALGDDPLGDLLEPRTPSSSETPGAFQDDGAPVAVGDAEGGVGEDRTLETLDRDGDDTEQLPGLGSPGNLFGFGPQQPPRPPPVANANKPALIAGSFADLGAYRATGDGFANAELDSLLADYGAFWGVDVRALATPDDATVTLPGAGDSAGKGVATHPPWVKALQNKIIGRAKWDADDHATQRLLEAFLRAFARGADGLPPGAEQLFHQIGASETNGQAGSLGGHKGASSWCAQASQFGLIIGMYNRGLRFKTDKHSTDYGAELTKQVAAYGKWTKRGGNVVGGKDAWDAPLEAGDIITVVNGSLPGTASTLPLSGHVATVVEQTDNRIVYVSGNAAGVQNFEGSVRIEEVNRERPPDGYDWLATAGRENTFVGLKQSEKKHRDAWRKDMDAMAIDEQTIRTNLPGVELPPVEYNVHASVAAFVGAAQLHIGQATNPVSVQAAMADMVFRGNHSNFELGSADADFNKQQAMLNDKGLPVSRQDKRFVAGQHAPDKPGTSWVVEVIKASALTTLQVLATGESKTVPNDPAIESGPTLAEQCPNAPREVIR